MERTKNSAKSRGVPRNLGGENGLFGKFGRGLLYITRAFTYGRGGESDFRQTQR